jgi:hypothetical protein
MHYFICWHEDVVETRKVVVHEDSKLPATLTTPTIPLTIPLTASTIPLTIPLTTSTIPLTPTITLTTSAIPLTTPTIPTSTIPTPTIPITFILVIVLIVIISIVAVIVVVVVIIIIDFSIKVINCLGKNLISDDSANLRKKLAQLNKKWNAYVKRIAVGLEPAEKAAQFHDLFIFLVYLVGIFLTKVLPGLP